MTDLDENIVFMETVFGVGERNDAEPCWIQSSAAEGYLTWAEQHPWKWQYYRLKNALCFWRRND